MQFVEQLFTSKDKTGLFRIVGEAISHEDLSTGIVVYQDLNEKGSSHYYMTKEEFQKTFEELKDDE